MYPAFIRKEKVNNMAAIKNKHLSLENRCIIQEFLDYSYSFTAIAKRIGKDRTTIAKEVKAHRFLIGTALKECELTSKPPYVCNGCDKKLYCKKTKYRYEASIAHNEYNKTLRETRAVIKATKQEIAAINDVISPLMINKHHSVNQVYIEHPEVLPFSKVTFYRYIDMGILNVKNIDLQRKVRYRTKKAYDCTRQKVNYAIKNGRFYSDFKDYVELHPNASIVEMDTVIGTQGGKGGKCFLTLLFRQYNLMLIYLMPYKRQEYVIQIFSQLKSLLGDDEFKRLFEVILTDNGTEFGDPDSIELSFKSGKKLISLFYCDPNCSWQKGSIEKNHEYIRYVLPKGTSFSGLSQDDCYTLASNINSVPRVSLNNHSPYEMAINFIGKENMDKFNIYQVATDDIDLSIRLLKK